VDIRIPELALVVLIGPSGSGKSTFARSHFKPTEIVSSDACRGLVADDENDQSATKDAFEVLHFIAGKRLQAGRLTVVDATSVQPEARKLRPAGRRCRARQCDLHVRQRGAARIELVDRVDEAEGRSMR